MGSYGCPRAESALDWARPTAPVLFGIWVADGAGPLAYDQPAAVYLRQDPKAWANRREGAAATTDLWLGGKWGGEGCGRSNFDLPSGTRKLRVGVRALDLAGNATAPAELTVPFAP